MIPEVELIQASRRELLMSFAGGAGAFAVSSLLSGDSDLVADDRLGSKTDLPPQAKNCIFIFLLGGPSQYDLFDPKPLLNRLDGQQFPPSLLKSYRFPGGDALKKSTAEIMASPREFRQYGESGMWFSDLVPNIAQCADDIAMVRTFQADQITHAPAQLFLNSGFARAGRPSIGAWLTYGLGRQSDELPNYVVLWAGLKHYAVSSLWSSGFLPGQYGGVLFNSDKKVSLDNLNRPTGIPADLDSHTLDAIRNLNRHRFEQVRDPAIKSRISNYEMAFRMQSAAPELLDFSKETKATLDAYGVGREPDIAHTFSANCLMARRMVERGVRFVNLYHSHWDNHDSIEHELPIQCHEVDQPIAALIKDLKARGLLDSTLVVWATEFGRTPFSEVRTIKDEAGRDHHRFAFPMWMAGGGVKGGTTLGETDEFGWLPTERPVHVHDFQATLLHLFGIEHERLTYRHSGRDFRLTDTGGEVIPEIIR